MSDSKDEKDKKNKKDTKPGEPLGPGGKKEVNQLPYIIVFAILFLVSLILITWVLDVGYKANSCGLDANIWCADDWTCNTPTCDKAPVSNLPISPCFHSVGLTGLASCLYGPDSLFAKDCKNCTTAGGCATGGVACHCPTGMAYDPNNPEDDVNTAMNCLNNCAINVKFPTSITGARPRSCCCTTDSDFCASVPDGKGGKTCPL